jgi:hypothetical protein
MRLMEQPWTVSEEKRIIERLLVAEWTSGGVARFVVCLLLPSKGAPLPRRSPAGRRSISSSSRNTGASALDDHHLRSPRAWVSNPCPHRIGTCCCLQDLGTDLILRQAHQLRGNLDLTLEVPG